MIRMEEIATNGTVGTRTMTTAASISARASPASPRASSARATPPRASSALPSILNGTSALAT
jgi:hypothetical protein